MNLVKRALISVFKKDDIVNLARALVKRNVEIVSTGGTARVLVEAGLPVTDVSAVSGFPEILDGRLKTLHPAILGGLLARHENSQHQAALKEHGLEYFQLVVVNLYPFTETRDRPGATPEEVVEMIDIGGPTMIRAAAKNHGSVAVVTDPADYEKLLGDLNEHDGGLCKKFRRKLAAKAFACTAEYDQHIAAWMQEQTGS
jgi:phosphoribosylaminoimidazolecarboxamide formyltransferase/IMP cyclohydrolase